MQKFITCFSAIIFFFFFTRNFHIIFVLYIKLVSLPPSRRPVLLPYFLGRHGSVFPCQLRRRSASRHVRRRFEEGSEPLLGPRWRRSDGLDFPELNVPVRDGDPRRKGGTQRPFAHGNDAAVNVNVGAVHPPSLLGFDNGTARDDQWVARRHVGVLADREPRQNLRDR
jgi:hypothetical protein